MKVTEKEIRECEEINEKGEKVKTTVLFLTYSHYGLKGCKIMVKDYNDEFYDYVLEQLKSAVRKAYPKGKKPEPTIPVTE
jgi:hypothetical protein